MAKAKKKTKHKKGKKQSLKVHVFLAFLLMLSIMFLPFAVILFVGLIPMFVAFFVDRSKKKIKAITVGAMNIAGCTPFLMELWKSEGTMEAAVSIIFNPMAIIVIYSAAGVGYIIDWAMTLIVASILYQRGTSRVSAIEKRQAELVERWGQNVDGNTPLDDFGFPLGDLPKPKD